MKVGQNPWVNLVHHGFRTGWIEIFLQISVRVNFWLGPPRTWLIRVEPVVSRVGLPIRIVTHIRLGFAMLGYFFNQTY